MEPILVNGRWQPSHTQTSFRVHAPADGAELPGEYPVSNWADCDAALQAASSAATALRELPGSALAGFLRAYAQAIEARGEELVDTAHRETALPREPRLRNVELVRTTTQLRQAAAAAQAGSWMQPVLDTKLNIRSCFAPMGPVVVFGPNNFPFAFNGIAGGDFAAAIATGCPVIAKAHPLHAATSRILAECAADALATADLPAATVQMLYHLEPEDGLRLVADGRVAATCFTGSRTAGLRLKAAAEASGRLFYAELSSLNPIVFLPGALRERGAAKLAVETADSGLAAAGQFCTSPNLLLLIADTDSDEFARELASAYSSRPASPLLSAGGRDHLHRSVENLRSAGARVLTGGEPHEDGACYRNTVLQVSGRDFLAATEALQQEAFGNATMVVLCADAAELESVLAMQEGNLTASVYSATGDVDAELYQRVATLLRPRCGRLLNDKMPTGVALSPAMNHGGPYPSTSHPGFTAVGIPRSLQRFGSLQCYDGVRGDRLPPALRDKAPHAEMWRVVDGVSVLG